MDKLFGDMTDDVIHYADDILIATSGNFSQHLRVVDKALKRITNGKIKIRPQKINLAKEEKSNKCAESQRCIMHVEKAIDL